MGKRQKHAPLENDWLFSCPARMPTEQIAAALRVNEQPVIEFSAKQWDSPGQMAQDVMRAYGYPEAYVSLYQPGKPVNWDSLNDWMFVRGWRGGQWQQGYSQRDFLGEVFLVRDCRAEAAESLAFLADLFAHQIRPIRKRPHLYPYTLVALILAGWTEPVLEARVAGQRVAFRAVFVVNLLPQEALSSDTTTLSY